MRELPIFKPVAKLEELRLLDPVVHEVQRVMNAILRPKALEDVLHGVPAGHPVHPVLVQIPIGTWTSAAVLDLVPGSGRASRLLVGAGVLASSAAILTGWADWARTHVQQQRVGVVHAAANEIGTVLYAWSWLERRRGNELRGRLVAYGAFGLIGVGGYLGGHLGYRQAVGANHAEGVLQRFPRGWQPIGPLDDLPERQPVRRDVGGEQLFVLRRGDRVDVLANLSSHLGEPLDQGAFEEGGEGPTITAPWQGSVYDVETGDVVHGPATSPQPRFDARVSSGLVEVRAPGAEG